MRKCFSILWEIKIAKLAGCEQAHTVLGEGLHTKFIITVTEVSLKSKSWLETDSHELLLQSSDFRVIYGTYMLSEGMCSTRHVEESH